MSDIVIHAAAYLGPEGFGNDQTGLREWPAPLAEPLRRGELDGLHWSLLSDSDPSRFLRMDPMCRLGFMATELLAVDFASMPASRLDRTGVCVESFGGSLDTDIRFARTPRPSLFAYTLPSTVIGEICIRFHLRGPVLSLVSPEPGKGGSIDEATDWLRTGDAEMCLCLGIEAVNNSIANSISLPPDLKPRGWHGAAILLGHAENSPREKPPGSRALVEACRDICLAAKTPCQTKSPADNAASKS